MNEAVAALLLGHPGDGGLIWNAGGVVIAEEFHVTAKRNGRDFPARCMPIGKAKKLPAESDRKHQDFHAAPASDQKMPKLVEEDHERQDEQKRNREAEHASAQDVDSGQKIKIHEIDIPGRPRYSPDRSF